MLIPKEKKNQSPAIIGLHGHGDTSLTFKNEYMGIDFVEQGFVVIMPSFRSMWCDEKLSKELLLNGFTKMGFRVYETLLLIKYLTYLDEVDNDNIGIIGHSGGSSVAHLVVRITDSIKVQVSDHCTNWLDMCGDANKIHCETIPYLTYYSDEIQISDYVDIPVLKVPYGFGENKELITEFFNDHLK